MSALNWLQEWYKSNCNNEWEHVYGIKICTIDNPGWMVEIELSETTLEGKSFEGFFIDNGDDWIMCRVVNNVFEGAGDPTKLEEMLLTFRKWATEAN